MTTTSKCRLEKNKNEIEHYIDMENSKQARTPRVEVEMESELI